MTSREVSSLGLKFKVLVPETVAEFDQLAKREGACLEAGIKNEVYRGVLSNWRPLFCAKLEELTGIKREVDKDGVPQGADKSDDAYTKRVYAEIATKEGIQDIDAVRQRYASVGQEIADLDDCKVDPSATERKVGAGNLVAKTYINIAREAQAGGKLAALAAKMTAGGFPCAVTDDAEASIMSVAKAIAAREAKKREALKEEYAV